ncbi:helix-turn-helix transcriptional regulator [Chitinophaga defluvii]|uniref:Helix-turn-helix transcriptional regulator n=1 Tax=Chitinophaga defluvii TaxID=3163343 RepID=A0ABV2T322_9BACT
MNEFEDIEQKLYQIERNITQQQFDIPDIAAVLPASVMIHHLEAGVPQEITYMNEWGSHRLGVELEALNAMKQEYYDLFFVQEDLDQVLPGILNYCQDKGAATQQFNFFQRVKLYKEEKHRWFYTVCKFLPQLTPGGKDQLIMLSSPVEGVGTLMNKVTKVLDENEYIANNYKKFARLTKREKEIISLLCEGKSSAEISDILFITKYTVDTHRKNIHRKIEAESFAQLMKFATAFDLV